MLPSSLRLAVGELPQGAGGGAAGRRRDVDVAHDINGGVLRVGGRSTETIGVNTMASKSERTRRMSSPQYSVGFARYYRDSGELGTG